MTSPSAPDPDGGASAAGPAVAPPAWLSEDARGYWHDIARHLPPAAITANEVHALGMLANELLTYAEADTLVQDAGIMITGAMGELLPNPALTIRDKAAAAVARWSAYLRITPTDRDLYVPKRPAADARIRHRREKASR